MLFGEVLTIGQGGIVFDSDPYDEWMETINKLGTFFNTFTAGASDCRLTAGLQVRTRIASPQLKRSIWPSRKTARAARTGISTRDDWPETHKHVSLVWLGKVQPQEAEVLGVSSMVMGAG